MHDRHVSTRLGEASRAHAVWEGSSSEVTALELHASEGCSVCARALVNAREMAVDVALSEAPVTPAAPTEKGRRALFDRTRRTLDARRATSTNASTSTSASASAPPAPAPSEKPRVLDSSAVVARKHIHGPGEEARIREVDALRAAEPRPGEGTARMLGQLARFLDFGVFFVSVVRGERVSYRVQRGLSDELSGFKELRREMSYCTHCVSAEAPFIIENAQIEPFFRGNRAVTRYRMAAYAGVPLRTTAGVVIGTLCALDVTPRTITSDDTAMLETFARRAVAEIERERTPALLSSVIEASSVRADVHAEAFFRDVVAAEHARASAKGASALLTVQASDATSALAWLDEHETAGRIGPAEIGILLPGVGRDAAAARFARLRGAAGPHALAFTLAPGPELTPADWIASAAKAQRA